MIPGSPESGSGRSLGVTRDPRSGLNQRPWVKPLLSPGQRSRDLAGGTGRRERRPQRSQGAWMGRGNGRRVNGDAAGNGRGRPSTGKRKTPLRFEGPEEGKRPALASGGEGRRQGLPRPPRGDRLAEQPLPGPCSLLRLARGPTVQAHCVSRLQPLENRKIRSICSTPHPCNDAAPSK